MVVDGGLTKREIVSQPEAWADTLRVMLEAESEIMAALTAADVDSVIFTGCGSTYYASLAAASVYSTLTGKTARGVPASELVLFPESVYPTAGRTLLVAVSRSGETSETLSAVRAFRDEDRGNLITLSCYPDQPLAQLGDVNIVLEAGQEASVVQTRAFTSLYAALIAFAAMMGKRRDILSDLARLPAAAYQLLEARDDWMPQVEHPVLFERCYFLGSGAQYGLACEASLKMKEMALLPTTAFHVFEFRHGPIANVTPETLVVGLLSARHADAEREVMAEVRALGGKTLTLGTHEADITFASDLGEIAQSLLYLLPLQWLAAERALRQGFNPDQPRNLEAVVRLQLT